MSDALIDHRPLWGSLRGSSDPSHQEHQHNRYMRVHRELELYPLIDVSTWILVAHSLSAFVSSPIEKCEERKTPSKSLGDLNGGIGGLLMSIMGLALDEEDTICTGGL